MNEIDDPRIPVTIVTGFLGCRQNNVAESSINLRSRAEDRNYRE